MVKVLGHGYYLKWAYDSKKGIKPKCAVELNSYDGSGLIDSYVSPHYQKADKVMQDKTSLFEVKKGIEIVKLNDGDIIIYDIDLNKRKSL